MIKMSRKTKSAANYGGASHMGSCPYMEILKFYLAPLKESIKNAKNRKLSKK